MLRKNLHIPSSAPFRCKRESDLKTYLKTFLNTISIPLSVKRSLDEQPGRKLPPQTDFGTVPYWLFKQKVTLLSAPPPLPSSIALFAQLYLSFRPLLSVLVARGRLFPQSPANSSNIPIWQEANSQPVGISLHLAKLRNSSYSARSEAKKTSAKNSFILLCWLGILLEFLIFITYLANFYFAFPTSICFFAPPPPTCCLWTHILLLRVIHLCEPS